MLCVWWKHRVLDLESKYAPSVLMSSADPHYPSRGALTAAVASSFALLFYLPAVLLVLKAIMSLLMPGARSKLEEMAWPSVPP